MKAVRYEAPGDFAVTDVSMPSGGATSVPVGDIVPFKLQTATGFGVDAAISMIKDPAQNIDLMRAELFRREIMIKGSYAEMTYFAAAIAALRTRRARTDGIISHKFPLDDDGKALVTLASDPTAHKVVSDARS
jgi:hypothetical protein